MRDVIRAWWFCGKQRLWAVGRQTGSYPEMGLEEINGDLPEQDFWTASIFQLARQPTGILVA